MAFICLVTNASMIESLNKCACRVRGVVGAYVSCTVVTACHAFFFAMAVIELCSFLFPRKLPILENFSLVVH